VLPLEVLVRELFTVDRPAASAITLGYESSDHQRSVKSAVGNAQRTEITALDHEALDDTVEFRALEAIIQNITIRVLSSSKSAEVFSSDRNSLIVETDDDTSHVPAAVLNVEIDLVLDKWALSRRDCGSGSTKRD